MSERDTKNQQALLALAALVEKLKYGTLDLSLQIHNSGIVALKVFGKKRLVFKNDNLGAIEKIGERISKAIQERATEKITFSVSVSDGKIREVVWLSEPKLYTP